MMRAMSGVLLIDDDEVFAAVLARALTRRGHAATAVHDAAAALAAAQHSPPAAVVLDLNLDGASGLPLIEPLLALAPGCRIVVLTGYASIATAVEAIKLGAVQYFAKPVEVDAIIDAFAVAPPPPTPSPTPPTPLSVDRLQWEHIQRVLQQHDGNVSATARALKMHRRTLQRRLAKRPVKA